MKKGISLRNFYTDMIAPLTKKETWIAGIVYLGFAAGISLFIQLLFLLVGDIVNLGTFLSGFESATLSGILWIMLLEWSHRKKEDTE